MTDVFGYCLVTTIIGYIIGYIIGRSSGRSNERSSRGVKQFTDWLATKVQENDTLKITLKGKTYLFKKVEEGEEK